MVDNDKFVATMMDQLVQKFPAQLHEALEIGSNASIKPHSHPIHEVYVAGLGGSGIGANFVAEFIRAESKVPFTIGKGYSIPNFIDKNTLVGLLQADALYRCKNCNHFFRWKTDRNGKGK